MNNKILTVVAILLAVFPFAAIAYELSRKESMTTVAVFVGIALVLMVTVIAAFAGSKARQS